MFAIVYISLHSYGLILTSYLVWSALLVGARITECCKKASSERCQLLCSHILIEEAREKVIKFYDGVKYDQNVFVQTPVLASDEKFWKTDGITLVR